MTSTKFEACLDAPTKKKKKISFRPEKIVKKFITTQMCYTGPKRGEEANDLFRDTSLVHAIIKKYTINAL